MAAALPREAASSTKTESRRALDIQLSTGFPYFAPLAAINANARDKKPHAVLH
jgi:hypothetical protein